MIPGVTKLFSFAIRYIKPKTINTITQVGKTNLVPMQSIVSAGGSSVLSTGVVAVILKRFPVMSVILTLVGKIPFMSVIMPLLEMIPNSYYIKILLIIKVILCGIKKMLNILLQSVVQIVKNYTKLSYLFMLSSFIYFLYWVQDKQVIIHGLDGFFRSWFPSIKLTPEFLNFLTLSIIIVVFLSLLLLFLQIFKKPSASTTGCETQIVQSSFYTQMPSENTLLGKLFSVSFFTILLGIMTYIGLFLYFGLPGFIKKYSSFKAAAIPGIEITSIPTIAEKTVWINELVTFLNLQRINPDTINFLLNKIDITTISNKEQLYSLAIILLKDKQNALAIYLNTPWYDVFLRHPVISCITLGFLVTLTCVLSFIYRDSLRRDAEIISQVVEVEKNTATLLFKTENNVREIAQKINFQLLLRDLLEAEQTALTNGAIANFLLLYKNIKMKFNVALTELDRDVKLLQKQTDQTILFRTRIAEVAKFKGNTDVILKRLTEFPEIYEKVQKSNPDFPIMELPIHE